MMPTTCTTRRTKKGSLKLGLLAVIMIVNQAHPAQKELRADLDQTRLKEILQKTADYCRKLENAVFDFVCLEEITEIIRLSPEFRIVRPPDRREDLGIAPVQRMERTQKNKYLYEYQLIRKKERNEERRTLMEKNGKKQTQKEAGLETTRFHYGKVVFGPVDLFRRLGQLLLDWKILGEEKWHHEKTIVIEASPKSDSKEFYPYGKIWLRESDYAIMKIEWNERSLTHYESVEEQARKSNAEPLITLVSEFEIEKNGIRFPSRLFCEEAYLNDKGEKTTSSETTVIYKDYKFFTVETEVTY